MADTDVQQVREVLQKFQDGYTRRDVTLLDDFRGLFIPEPELEVIGTGAVSPEDGEWCMGSDAACAMIKNDWEGWGDLKLDINDAHIHVLGDVAWLATTCSVNMVLKRSETYANYLESMRRVIDDTQTDPRTRLLEVLRGGANTLFEAERGEDYTWPLRFTAVLVRREGQWLFSQMQFSFATTRFPDVRNV